MQVFTITPRLRKDMMGAWKSEAEPVRGGGLREYRSGQRSRVTQAAVSAVVGA